MNDGRDPSIIRKGGPVCSQSLIDSILSKSIQSVCRASGGGEAVWHLVLHHLFKASVSSRPCD